MARARLVGHCEIMTIQPIARGSLIVDDDADEPYSAIARGASIEILAQVNEIQRNERRPGQAGAEIPTRMRLTFLTRRARALGWSPADGDRIVQIADRNGSNPRAVNLYLRGARFAGKTSYGNELIVIDVTDQKGRTPNEGLL